MKVVGSHGIYITLLKEALNDGFALHVFVILEGWTYSKASERLSFQK